MRIIEKEIVAKDLITKSNLPASDYVINPYVGCPHACKYCYAHFMKRFTGHTEEWGDFIDIKRCDKPMNVKKLYHKSVFISSVTDCYNPFEEKYRITRNILKQLKEADCSITISTKSALILRDIDILKELNHLRVAISINTLDNGFQRDMDNASSIAQRIAALKELGKQGIYTVLFPRATSQVAACRHLATAARVKYPVALQRCKFYTPLLAAVSLIYVAHISIYNRV